jgi:hypothetical protein
VRDELKPPVLRNPAATSRPRLARRYGGLLRLKKASAERIFAVTDDQIEALERFGPEFSNATSGPLYWRFADR